MLTQVCPPRKNASLAKVQTPFSSYKQANKKGPRWRNRGFPQRSQFKRGRKKKKKKGRVQAVSELLQASLSHTVDLQAGSESSDQQGAALSLWSFLVLSVPHASFGVVVVKEVPQTESFHLQTILQHPGRTEREKPPG